MKNIFLLFVGLVASSASFAAANEPIKPLATAYLIGNEKVRLVVAPQEVWATLALQDEQGHVLYFSNVNLRDGLKQNFDVSGLEKGVYKLSIEVGKEMTVQSFTVTEVPSHPLITLQGE
ncbi:hypothetical protein BH09BAC4_BH09BAC4_03170 [soil metagenome]